MPAICGFFYGVRKMPLPSVEQFIGTNVTEHGFKEAQKQFVEYVGNEVPKKVDTDADFANKANKATTLAGYGIADAYTKAQVDSSIAAVSGGHKAYQTLALAQADQASLPANTVVEVTNDPTSSNNGTYQWNGTTLTKSAYDPLTQAKASSIQKDSALHIYSATNLINNGAGSKNKKMEGMIYGTMKWAKIGTSYSKIIPVVAGVEIYIRSDKDNWWNYGAGFACGFFNQLPVFGDTVIPVNWAATLITRNGVRYSKLNVPTDAKYLVLNEFFAEVPEQGSAKWFVSYKEFVDTFEASEQSFLASVNYDQIKASSVFGNELTSKSLLVQKSGMVYDKSIYRSGYITPTKTINYSTGPDWRTAIIDAQSGREYFAKIDQTAFPFNIACCNATVDEYMGLPIGSQLLDAKIEAYDLANSIYKIIFDEKFKRGTLLITTKVDEWGTYTFNIVDSLKVWTDEPSSLDISRDEIDKIDSKPLADSFARKLAVEANSKTQLQSNFFKNIGVGSNIFLFGDSISTANYSGGYYRFIESALSAKVTSYASNAANTNRMYGVVLGKRSRNDYDEDTPYPQKDFSICDIALIAIGTNDAARGDDFWDTLDSIPAGSVFDHVADNTTDAYFESFPATFFGNVGACIEYIKWKNPKTRIYLLSPLNANGKDRRTLVKYYSELAAYYSIPLINATEDSGLDLKNISIWTNDNLHPNEVGNEIFGNFIARKIISM